MKETELNRKSERLQQLVKTYFSHLNINFLAINFGGDWKFQKATQTMWREQLKGWLSPIIPLHVYFWQCSITLSQRLDSSWSWTLSPLYRSSSVSPSAHCPNHSVPRFLQKAVLLHRLRLLPRLSTLTTKSTMSRRWSSTDVTCSSSSQCHQADESGRESRRGQTTGKHFKRPLGQTTVFKSGQPVRDIEKNKGQNSIITNGRQGLCSMHAYLL